VDDVSLLGLTGWRWLSAPASYEADGDRLVWRCAGNTDFWRKTGGVPSKHNGPALLLPASGSFTIMGTFEARFSHTYDQIGFLVEMTQDTWLKVGIEIDDGLWLSAVHTVDSSDWSREPIDEISVPLRLVRTGATLDASVFQNREWRMFRSLSMAGDVRIGPYSCAPKGPGFEGRMLDTQIDLPAGDRERP
jgi:uncharacterized protein